MSIVNGPRFPTAGSLERLKLRVWLTPLSRLILELDHFRNLTPGPHNRHTEFWGSDDAWTLFMQYATVMSFGNHKTVTCFVEAEANPPVFSDLAIHTLFNRMRMLAPNLTELIKVSSDLSNQIRVTYHAKWSMMPASTSPESPRFQSRRFSSEHIRQVYAVAKFMSLANPCDALIPLEE